MSQLARLGFLLLGLYLILDPLGGLAAQLGLARAEDLSAEAIAFSAGWWAVFGLLPGVLLVFWSRTLADFLFPSATEEPQLDTRALVTAGVAVLGASLLIGGLSRAAGSVALALATLELPGLSRSWAGEGIRGILETACGVVLMVKAGAIVSFLFRPSGPHAAA